MIIGNNLKMYVQKLRSSNLRPTKQRLKICQFLFDKKKTFHFTVETLNKKINKNGATKVSLATIYNTVEAFTSAGYLKEILTSKPTLSRTTTFTMKEVKNLLTFIIAK